MVSGVFFADFVFAKRQKCEFSSENSVVRVAYVLRTARISKIW